MTNKGLRRILIAIILITSVSLTTFFWVLSSGTFAPEEEDQASYFIEGARIFDGDTLLAGPQNLRVVAGEITCIGDSCTAKTDDIRIDAKGKTLLPGFVDQYVQLYAPGQETQEQSGLSGLMAFAQQRPAVRRNLIRAGITSIRSIGDVPDNIYLLENQIASGKMAGPRIFPAGPFITAYGGHPVSTRYVGNDPLIQQGTRQISQAEDADGIVKDLYGAGMLGIHLVYEDRSGSVAKLDSQVVRALITAAESRGMWVSAQTDMESDLLDLTRWGVNAIFFSGTINAPAALQPLAEQNVWLVPNLSYDQEAWTPLPYSVLDSMGLLIGVGSSQHHSKHRFGEALHAAIAAQLDGKRDPLSILRALTSGAAQNLRADERIGRIRQGLQADLLLIQGEDWLDTENWKRPDWVMAQGRVLVQNGQIVED